MLFPNHTENREQRTTRPALTVAQAEEMSKETLYKMSLLISLTYDKVVANNDDILFKPSTAEEVNDQAIGVAEVIESTLRTKFITA